MYQRTFTFVEPHITGGTATIEVTEKEILKYMRSKRHKRYKEYQKLTDDLLLDYFVTNNWCVEK